jgi:hypothetical protein
MSITLVMSISDSRGYSVLEVLFVAAISVTLAAIAIPMSGNAVGHFRLSGDARSVSNAIALTKMRAASRFSQARLYVDLSTKAYHLETYRKAGSPGWVWDGGSTPLSQNASISYGSLGTPPPSTQAAIGQAPACLTNAGEAIANTACVVFNSRGIPINCSSMSSLGCSPAAPTADDAIYLTDGTAVYSITVAASGMVQLWRSPPSTASWVKQ